MRDEFKGPGAIDRARQYYKDMLTKLNKKKSTKKVT